MKKRELLERIEQLECRVAQLESQFKYYEFNRDLQSPIGVVSSSVRCLCGDASVTAGCPVHGPHITYTSSGHSAH